MSDFPKQQTGRSSLVPLGSDKLRVLLISHTCQSKTEGQPKAELIAAMNDVDLKVLVPDRWTHYGQIRTADVPQESGIYEMGRVRLPWLGPAQYYLHHYPQLSRLLKKFQPDVIDLWEEPWGLVSAHACRLRNRLLPNARIISETEQNLDRRLPLPFELFRSYTLRHADFLIGRSSEAVDVACRRGYEGPATVVPNAVDTKLFQPMNRAECRRKLRWSEDQFIVGYAGRLVERKGITDFLDALNRCPVAVAAVFVGDGPMATEITRRATMLQTKSRIQLLANMPPSELPVLMNALDVLVLPSRTVPTWKEQFGRVIIEAQACAVPIIGSNSGAIPEVVAEGGLIFPERDIDALAQHITTLQGRPDLATKLGVIGLQQVEAKYTWAKVAERMARIYRTCQRKRNGSDRSSARSYVPVTEMERHR